MKPLLLLVGTALLLLAAALELWWGAPARAQRRASLRHLRSRLQPHPEPVLANVAQTAPHRRDVWTAWLLRAGLPTTKTSLLRLLLPVLLLAVLAGLRLHSLVAALAMGLLCVLLDWAWLLWRSERQQRAIAHQLPDFLDNMVRVIGTGNSLPVAFQRAATETRPPLRGVLTQTLGGVHAGMDMSQALQRSSRIYHIEALQLLQAIVSMSERYGGRTDQILQRMGDFMRDLEQAQQEVKAVTAETRISSWVLGLLPVVSAAFMMLVDPDFFEPMFHQALGHKLLLAALLFELAGAFLLRRLARSV
jgi:tight adherence protein B